MLNMLLWLLLLYSTIVCHDTERSITGSAVETWKSVVCSGAKIMRGSRRLVRENNANKEDFK